MEIENNIPEIILGTMTFGRRVDEKQAEEMLQMSKDLGVVQLDTAYMYGGGLTEEMLGMLKSTENFAVATKANPWATSLGLKPSEVRRQLQESLKRMGKDNVDIFYLHAPCHKTPIMETLAEVNKLHQEGKFKELALSNYSSWQVMEIYHLCNANHWVLPTIYQGMYNPITRQVEGELFPCLRKLGIRFFAYNPLAGGVLTGKHSYEDVKNNCIKEGRFKTSEVNKWAKKYRQRFWHPCHFKTVDKLRIAIAKAYPNSDVNLVEVTLRWMMHHSKLGSNDGIILGASSIDQLKQNFAALSKPPLDPSIVAVFDEGWVAGSAVDVCPLYYR